MHPKILLVDDREDNLFSIEAILEPKGYRFVRARSGREALKILLAEFDFAMILMDVKMPNLNGFETASLIYERERLKHIPIIFITADNYGEENMYKGYQTGAIDYIFKPINPDILRAKVGVLVDLYRKNRLLMEHEKKLVIINKTLELEIKDRKLSEQKVNQLNRELLIKNANLENANKSLERFAFMASHDLQEPLRKIRMFSDKLSIKHKDAQDADLIRRIQRAAERTQTLIADILAFSKTSTDPSDFSNVDLNNVIEELLQDINEEVLRKNASITVQRLPQLQASQRLMRPLFQNLISNALKYSSENRSPKIMIRSEMPANNHALKTEYNSNYCRIFIEDNGIGFDQKYAEEIFGMFRRLHGHSEYEGTGIGLALCKKIVEQHQGYISARSKVGEGSTFIVSFPIV